MKTETGLRNPQGRPPTGWRLKRAKIDLKFANIDANSRLIFFVVIFYVCDTKMSSVTSFLTSGTTGSVFCEFTIESEQHCLMGIY